eukprot:351328-Chlamydomonas_euryale.AAC.9
MNDSQASPSGCSHQDSLSEPSAATTCDAGRGRGRPGGSPRAARLCSRAQKRSAALLSTSLRSPHRRSADVCGSAAPVGQRRACRAGIRAIKKSRHVEQHDVENNCHTGPWESGRGK